MSAVSTSSARVNMLKSQILTGNVLAQPLLDALMEVPRESFVPAQYQGVAYIDEEVPLLSGRFLMEPLAFARMLKQAAITREHTVLDIGCASGYSTCVLSRLAGHVVAVEEDETLFALALKNLATRSNVTLSESPLVQGFQARGPYDVILIEGAIEFVPQALADQLKEGGRLIAFEQSGKQRVGTSGLNNFVEYRKIQEKLYPTILGNASVAALMQFNKPAAFTF